MGNKGMTSKYPIKATQRGQGMTEYIVIVALIAIATIAVVSLFGQTVRNQVAGMAMELSGKSAIDQVKAAEDSAKAATTSANVKKGLDSYNSN